MTWLREAVAALTDAVALLRRRFVDVSLMLVLAGLAMIATVMLGALIVGPRIATAIAEAESIEIYGQVGMGAGLTMVVIVIAAVLVWSGVVVRIGDAALADRSRSAAGPLRAGLRRAPRMGLVSLTTIVAFIVLAALWPIISAIGIIGLVADLLVRKTPARWPTRRTLLTLAIPGGAAFMVLARWSLGLAAAVLDSTSTRDALRRSTAATRGRIPQVTISLAGATVLTLAVTYATTQLGGLVGGGNGAVVARLVSQLLLAALPLLVVTVLYHRGQDDGRVVADTVAPRTPRLDGGASVRIATVVAMALFLQTAAVAGVGSAPASATNHDTVAVSVTFVPFTGTKVGEPVTIKVHASPSGVAVEYPYQEHPDGTVEIWWDGVYQAEAVDQGSGEWRLVTTDLPVGDTVVTAKYLGDDDLTNADWQPGEGSNTAEVRYATSIALGSDANPSTLGDDVTFTAALTADGAAPTGQVEFIVNSGAPVLVPVVSGSASHTESSLPEGDAFVTARYLGEGLHAASDVANLTQSVGRLRTSASFSLAGASPSLAADPVTATVSVSNLDDATTPTGTVDIFNNRIPFETGVPVVNGEATVDLDLAVGNYFLTAKYVASGGFIDSAAPETVFRSVTKRASETAVSIAPTATLFGESVTATATVTFPGTARVPTGDVQFVNGNRILSRKTLVGGSASFTTSSLAEGTQTMEARYLGDDVGLQSSDTATVEVSPLPLPDIRPTVILYGPTNPTEYTEDVVFSVWLRPAPPAGVTVSLSDRNLATLATGVLDADGRATLTVVNHDAGVQYYSVLFPGVVDGPQTYLAARSAERQHTILQAATAMTASIGPQPLLATETATITALLTSAVAPHPTGSVEIRSLPDFRVLGDVPLANGEVALDTVLSARTQNLQLTYDGDVNFLPVTINIPAPVQRRTPDLTLTVTPAAPVYGDLITLRASALGGGGVAVLGTVTFFSRGRSTVGTAQLVNGVAEVEVCAGRFPACPVGHPAVFVESLSDFRFDFAATTEFLAETSDAVPTTVGRAPTTVDMTIRPDAAQIPPGSAVYLDVAISSHDPALIPTGSVVWSAIAPGAPDAYIDGSVLSATGTAGLQLTAGQGFLTSEVTAIRVEYFQVGLPAFVPTSAIFPVNVLRAGITVSVDPITTDIATDVTPKAVLRPAPGHSRLPTGIVTFTSDTGQTCDVPVRALVVSGCTFIWRHAGSGTISASYSGDSFYLAAPAVTNAVSIGQRAPDYFYIGVGSTYERGESGTVTWQLPPAVTTGEVHVFVDQQPFCVEPVLAGTCTGIFDPDDRSDERVELWLQYRGDDDWGYIEQKFPVNVLACYPVSVLSYIPGEGSAAATTPPNCSQAGVPGYRVGTVVTAVATPTLPYEFDGWMRPALTGSDPVRLVSTTATYTVRVTHSYATWESIATFRLPCLTPALSTAQGFGNLLVDSPTNCQTPAGTPGWEWGTTLRVRSTPGWNADYAEYDRFIRFEDTLFPSAIVPTIKGDALEFVINAPAMPVRGIFGPFCRALPRTDISRAHPDDAVTRSTPPIDCFSPGGDGHRRTTPVQVSASPGNASSVLAGWSIDGAPNDLLGRNLAISVVPTDVRVTIAPQFVACWSVDVDALGFRNLDSEWVGSAVRDTAPNCPDGSDRFVEGTPVSMTATVSAGSAEFRGWSTTGEYEIPRPPVLQKTVLATADERYYANFFDRRVCSRLVVIDWEGLVAPWSLLQSGCGPGYYFDQYQFDRAAGLGSPEQANCCRLGLDIDRDAVGRSRAGINVRGQAPDCWPLDCNGPLGGGLTVRVGRCQDLLGTARILRPGEELTDRGTRASLSPGSWIAELDADEDLICGEHSYPPGTALTVIPSPPTSGYEFLQWENVAGLQSLALFTADDGTDIPVARVMTDTSSPRLNVGTVWRVNCFTLSVGAEVTIVEPPPNCPFPEFGGNAYAKNTLVFVQAQKLQYGSRDFEEWRSSGGVSNLGLDADTNQPIAVAVMDQNKSVWADYITPGDQVTAVAAFAGRIMIGIAAMVAVGALGAALTAVCPPCGVAVIAFSVGVVASIALSAIPGVGDGPARIAAMMDPFSCIGSWSFNNDAAATTPGGKKVVTTTIKASVDIAEEVVRTSEAAATTGSKFARYAGSYASKMKIVGGAGLAVGVVSNLASMDFSYQSGDDQFTDRGLNQCYQDQYSI